MTRETGGDSRGEKILVAAYRWALRLYPRALRDRFAGEMVRDVREIYRERRTEGGLVGPLQAWGRVGLDLVRSLPREWRAAAWRGGREAKGRRPDGSLRRDDDGIGRWTMAMADLWRDASLAARGLARRPGFTAVAVTTLALGIGANTLIFSLVSGIVLTPLPFHDPERLVAVREVPLSGEETAGQTAWPNFRDLERGSRSFESLAAYTYGESILRGGDEATRVLGARVTPGLFPLLGADAALGRTLGDADETEGAPVVLSHGLWQQAFSGDPEVLGRQVSLGDTPGTVVGVMPPEFGLPRGARLWTPLRPEGSYMDRRDVHVLYALGRLDQGVSLETAREEVGALAARLREAHPVVNAGDTFELRPLSRELVGSTRGALALLQGVVVLVLLVACANLANLFLVRGRARTRELAVRAALGASRFRRIRELLVESTLVAVTGGVAGALVAYVGFDAVLASLPGDLPRLDQVALDGRVLAFTFALALVTVLAFGLWPALRSTGGDPSSELGDRASGEGPGGGRARLILAGGQLAGSVILLVTAGLLLRSLWTLSSTDPGFDPENLLSVTVSLSGTELRSAEEVIRLYGELPGRLEALPGVRAASAVSRPPVSGGDAYGSVTVEGRSFPPEDVPSASFRRVLPGYFRTMEIPLLAGRTFRASDRGEEMVVIVSQGFARRFWDDPAEALGSRIKVGPADREPWLLIVGVVGDVRNVGLDEEIELATYEPYAQRPRYAMSLLIRTEPGATSVARAVRETVRSAGGDVPVYQVQTLSDRIRESLAPRRILLILVASFAGLAVFIAGVGVYGVLAYSVSRRTRELGIRMALGAGEASLARLVLGRGLLIVGGGLVVGLAGAVAATRVLGALIPGVSPTDPLTFASATVLLGAVALLACWAPARRAMRVDPVRALSAE